MVKDSSLTNSSDHFLPTPPPYTCCLAARLDINKIIRIKKKSRLVKNGTMLTIVFKNMRRTQWYQVLYHAVP
jgi:hypothetical protein